jgi:Na+-translocating ferredoxin:NAD+ oxidoreductase subunit B
MRRRSPAGRPRSTGALARLLGLKPLPLNPQNGPEMPPRVAQIDEERCIGCAKCLPPCPVDAIVGAARRMHTVIVELCTGCELCMAPCPVDCIAMVATGDLKYAPKAAPPPELNRERFLAHGERLERRAREHAAVLAARKQGARGEPAL